MKDNKKFKKVLNFEVYSKNPYAITVIGDPISTNAYLVINIQKVEAINFYKNQLIKLDDSDKALKEELEFKINNLASTKNELKSFRLNILNKEDFNEIMNGYKVPLEIFPHNSPNNDVEIEAHYNLVELPAKLNLKVNFKFNFNQFSNFKFRFRSKFLRGIPTNIAFPAIDDIEIKLNKTVIDSLLIKGAISIGDLYR